MSDYGIYHQPHLWLDYQNSNSKITTTTSTTYIPNVTVPDKLITRRDLKIFCNRNNLVITKEIFEEMENSIPLGVDLLTELAKIGCTNHQYIQDLLREKKLKRILK